MTWFLRLFARYRNLEALHTEELNNVRQALLESEQQALLLQDRLDAAIEDRNRTWELVKESLAGERKALHMQINEAWGLKYGTTPYAGDPHLPTAAQRKQNEPGPIGPRRELPSQRIARATEEFVNREAAKMGHG